MKDSHPRKFEWRSHILVRLSFRELYMIQSCVVCNLWIIWPFHRVKVRGQNEKSSLWFHETLVVEAIFVTLIENPSVITNETQGPQKYPHHWK